MKTRVFENQKYTLEEIIEAVHFGCDLVDTNNSEYTRVPIDIIKEWLSTRVERTAEEWQKLTPEIKVINHEGWEKKNFKKNWYEEKISYQEYKQRRDKSTCIGLNKEAV